MKQVSSKSNFVFNVMLLQGIYYLLTGLWPLFHIKSFMIITGHKTDIWLVKTVGLMICCLAAGLWVSYLFKQLSFCVIVIALTGIISLTAIDLYYSMKGIISTIYLADAAAEILLLLLWLTGLYRVYTQSYHRYA